MAGLREIGGAFVRLFVKKDELSAGLKQAENEVVGSVVRMNRETEKVSKGPLKQVQSLLNSTLGVVVSIVGKATLIASIVTAIVAGLAAAYRWATGISEAAEKAKKSFDDFSKSLKNLDEKSAADRDPFSQAALNQRIKAARAPFEEAAKAAQEAVAEASAEQRSLRMFLFGSDEDVAKAKQRYDALSQLVQSYYDAAEKAEAGVRNDFSKEASDRVRKAREEASKIQAEADKNAAEISEAVSRQQEENRLYDWREKKRLAEELVQAEYEERMRQEKALTDFKMQQERELQDFIRTFSDNGSASADLRAIKGMLTLLNNRVAGIR